MWPTSRQMVQIGEAPRRETTNKVFLILFTSCSFYLRAGKIIDFGNQINMWGDKYNESGCSLFRTSIKLYVIK